MSYHDSLRSLYNDAKDYQLEIEEITPLSCELNNIDVEYSEKKLIASGGVKSIYKVFQLFMSASCSYG